MGHRDSLERFLNGPIGPVAFRRQGRVAAKAKERIASFFLESRPIDGLTYFDTGTTMHCIASALATDGQIRDLAVLTHDVGICLRVGHAGIKATLLGGDYDPVHGCTRPDRSSIAALRKARTVLISAASLQVDRGSLVIRSRNRDQILLKRMLLRHGHKQIIVIDGEKIGRYFDGEFALRVRAKNLSIVTTRPSRSASAKLLDHELAKFAVNVLYA